MKVANTEVGGLAGGLYEIFEDLGLRFFSGLIGAVRAKRLELEYQRVMAGAAVVGGILGFVAGLISFFLTAFTRRSLDTSLGYSIIDVLIPGPFIGSLLFG